MAENDNVGESRRKHTRQPPSVPFLWEEKPGVPKKDWKPGMSLVTPILTPPAKRVPNSNPFNWEEEPEKLLHCFPLSSLELSTPPSHPFYSEAYENSNNNNNKNGNCITNSSNYVGVDSNHKQGLFKLEVEAFGFEMDYLFGSSSSLLANCLVPSAAISTAVPAKPIDDVRVQIGTNSSLASETDSIASSYATGVSSLVRASFLEYLFPLLPPKSGFLQNAAYLDNAVSYTLPEIKSKDYDGENNSSMVVRRPTTLGELIMMSRRRSYQRKVAQLKNDLSMEFMKKRDAASCILTTSMKLTEGLQWKKLQPRMKLL